MRPVTERDATALKSRASGRALQATEWGASTIS
jgi:hypothetical protein